MKFMEKEKLDEKISDKTDVNTTTKRHYLRTEEELKKAKEETENCPYCDSGYINCGLDCIYHIPKPETEDERYCRCTCKEKAGVIETRNYCSYKKTSVIDDFNDLNELENYNEVD